MTKQDLIQILKQEIAKETGIPLNEIEDGADFFSLGLDSISCVFVLDKLEKKLKVELNPIFFWDYPTIDSLSGHIASLAPNE
jgi:acyl carrier protein